MADEMTGYRGYHVDALPVDKVIDLLRQRTH